MEKNPKQFLEQHETATYMSERLQAFVDVYHTYHKDILKPLNILDIGCGREVELLKYKIKGDRYCGCDFYESVKAPLDEYRRADFNSNNISEVWQDQKFDVIFCGEVIEHVFSPDSLLTEMKALMHEDSILVLSTPNLDYYVNRILLLLGISPLYLENSSEKKLGRKFKALGQGNVTEGHIRLFTYGALKDILTMYGFKIVTCRTMVSQWNFWPDKIFCHLHPSLAATNVITAKKI